MLVLPGSADGHLAANIEGQRDETRIRPGSLTFVPHGLKQFYEFRGTVTNTAVSLNKHLFDHVIAMNIGFDSAEILEARLAWTGPTIQKLIEDQYASMASGEIGWQVHAEANGLKLAVEILRAFGGDRKTDFSRAALSQVQVSQVTEFIDEEIYRNFGLSDMAEILGLDPFSFTRSFKAATGETPHQYVIQRRIMHAQTMLQHTSQPIADVAYACGFSSQAHLTSTFTKHLGTTPGAYRRECGSERVH